MHDAQAGTGTRFAALIAAALCVAPLSAGAAECPPKRQPDIALPTTPLNIDVVKGLLKDYHASRYDADLRAVATDAKAFVEETAGRVTKPALVLDIDETSLSNWPAIKASDFGFIPNGACERPPDGPCGFTAWILKAEAPPIQPTLELFNAAVAQGVAVFFITGRRNSQRAATMWNLDRAGFEGWTKLITRGDSDTDRTSEAYKTEHRARIAELGYTVIANVGDQESDLAGDNAGCRFKLPNPFYLVK